MTQNSTTPVQLFEQLDDEWHLDSSNSCTGNVSLKSFSNINVTRMCFGLAQRLDNLLPMEHYYLIILQLIFAK